MKKKGIQVRVLASQVPCDIDEALIELMDAGIQVTEPGDYVPRNQVLLAKRTLGLSVASKKDLCEISRLARDYNLSEGLVRQILYEKHIISKKRFKRIPFHKLKEANIILSAYLSNEYVDNSDSDFKKQHKRKKRKIKKQASTDISWPTIGLREKLSHLSAKDVEDIHNILVEDFSATKDPIDPPGVRDMALLESAVFRPHTSLGSSSKYPSVAMAAAALLHSIVHDHPFHNGNKRTALVSMLVLLDKNGWVFTLEHNAIYDFVMRVSSHTLKNKNGHYIHGADEEMIHISRWIQCNIRRIRKGEQPLQFRVLRNILQVYNCEFEYAPSVANRINIKRGNLKTQIAYRNEGSEVPRNAIHKVRKDLHLDEDHGYDSDIFYKKEQRIPIFVTKYRRVLDKLAKV